MTFLNPMEIGGARPQGSGRTEPTKRIIEGIAMRLIAAYKTIQTTRPETVNVDRQKRVLSFISEQDIQQSAAEAYARQLQTANADGRLNENTALVRRIRTISQRLIQQTATFRDDALSWPWEVSVLTSEELSAYAMPGGKIMVYSGLVIGLDLNDAELAAAIGHEIAHTLREHGRERISSAYGRQLIVSLRAQLPKVSPLYQARR